MPIKNNFFNKYPNKYFIESGSHVGDGIQKALDAGCYGVILSVELSQKYFQICKNRFKNNKNVILYLGDTEDLFPKILENVTSPATFWLDGHNSGGDTAWGKHESPLIQELEIIKNNPIKNHTIIIDDLRCWEKPHYDFDKNDIILLLKSINNNYTFEYENGHIENDILIASIRNE